MPHFGQRRPAPSSSGSPVRRRRGQASLGDGHSFVSLLARVRPEVDRRLEDRLSALSKQARRHGVEPTIDALRELVLRGGKRFRAGLAVAAFAGIRPRARWAPALDAGAALELLHAYLLVQDDWMDRDDTRRGGPSVHIALARQYGSRALGDASAILSSDFGWGLAVQALAEAPVAATRVVRALEAFGEAHRDVLIGQQLDVLGRSDHIEQMHALKTGSYTVRGPLLVGACLAGAPASTLNTLRRFAVPLGIAYQVRDDLLGAFGEPALTGKPFAGDLREGKRTVVTAAAGELLDPDGLRCFRAVWANPRAGERALRLAAEHMDRAGVRRAVQSRLAQLCGRARRLARKLEIHSQARSWLLDAVALVGAPPSASGPGPALALRPSGRTGA